MSVIYRGVPRVRYRVIEMHNVQFYMRLSHVVVWMTWGWSLNFEPMIVIHLSLSFLPHSYNQGYQVSWVCGSYEGGNCQHIETATHPWTFIVSRVSIILVSKPTPAWIRLSVLSQQVIYAFRFGWSGNETNMHCKHIIIDAVLWKSIHGWCILHIWI